MTNRTVKYAAAMLFGMIGPGGLFSIPASADDASTVDSVAADKCLSGPKGAAPQGSHWYYHLEKGTARKCWYLGSQGAKVNSSAPVARTSSPGHGESADADDNQQAMQPSVANAHAELQTTTPAPAALPNPSHTPPAPGLLSSQVSAPNATTNIPGSAQTLASRWPDPDTFKPAAPQAMQQVAAQSPAPSPGSDQVQQQQPAAAPSIAPRSSPAPAQTAPAQSIGAAMSPVRIMLAALFLVLAISAIFARSAFRYFSRPPAEIARRRDIWAQDHHGERPFTPYEEMVTPERRGRDVGQPREEADEIEYLLRRVAKREARQRYFSS